MNICQGSGIARCAVAAMLHACSPRAYAYANVDATRTDQCDRPRRSPAALAPDFQDLRAFREILTTRVFL